MESRRIFLVTLFLCFFIFMFLGFSFAEDLTITTYYPSPYGAYNQLNTNTLQFGKQSVTPAAGCSLATEGLTFYGTISGVANLYVCTYNNSAYSWWPVVVFPSVAVDFGGYTRGEYDYYSGSGLIALHGGWSAISPATMYSDYAFRISMANQPAGEYQFTWSVNADVDQYGAAGTGYLRVYAQLYDAGSGAWVTQDSQDLTDSDLTNSNIFTTTGYEHYSASDTERTFSKYWGKQSATAYRLCRIIINKNLGISRMRARINNATFRVVRPST